MIDQLVLTFLAMSASTSQVGFVSAKVHDVSVSVEKQAEVDEGVYEGVYEQR